MTLVTLSLIPLNLNQNSIVQRVILAILQMLVAVSYWLIAENKEEKMTMTKLILQVFQLITIAYSLSLDDQYSK
jgi:heme/copper-type cytochrome/quinol oxidase subunit 4